MSSAEATQQNEADTIVDEEESMLGDQTSLMDEGDFDVDSEYGEEEEEDVEMSAEEDGETEEQMRAYDELRHAMYQAWVQSTMFGTSIIIFQGPPSSSLVSFGQNPPRNVSSLFGDESTSLKETVFRMAEEYFQTDPGNDYAIANTWHTTLKVMMLGVMAPDEENLMKCLIYLEYRLNLIAVADEHVTALNLSLPDGKTCAEWDWSIVSSNGDHPCFVYLPAIYKHAKYLLPPPFAPAHLDQGYGWDKPHLYLAMAFLLSGLDQLTVRHLLESRAEVQRNTLRQSEQYQLIKRASDVVAARIRLFQAYGKGDLL